MFCSCPLIDIELSRNVNEFLTEELYFILLVAACSCVLGVASLTGDSFCAQFPYGSHGPGDEGGLLEDVCRRDRCSSISQSGSPNCLNIIWVSSSCGLTYKLQDWFSLVINNQGSPRQLLIWNS